MNNSQSAVVLGQKSTAGDQSDEKTAAVAVERETLRRADETLQAAEIGDGLNDGPFEDSSLCYKYERCI
jgi:hypothetical protein